ncbi:MAG: DNA polymerase III subunit delta [Proteobacteria bacterium]|nr:DNA polymerase III subunit delta [Pseudomonadota bacterium]MDA1331430.1 DNA polymerase III subunit delta [Pseudomonadota bacterium]
MQIELTDLRKHLKSGLSTLYIVYGDEILLNLEATDLIRRTAKSKGFEDRAVLIADNHFDWSKLKEQSQSVSLFSSNKIIDLRIPSGKPGKLGSDTLQSYVKHLPENTITLITLPALDRNVRSSKWFSEVGNSGVSVEAKKVYREQLPRWIGHRLMLQNQTTEQNALQLIAERVEGNLISAHQEILKLGLLLPEGHLSTDDVRNAVVDVAQFDPFDLGPAILNGDKALLIRILRGLEKEGLAPPLVLWVIAEEAKILLRVKTALTQGLDMRSACADAGAWGLRQKLIPNIVHKLTHETLRDAVILASEIDKQIKGLQPGSSWINFLELGLSIIPSRI